MIYLITFIVMSNMLTSAAVTTNNRLLLSSVVVGTTLAASLCEYHTRVSTIFVECKFTLISKIR